MMAKGSTFGVMSLGSFQKCVCGPTSVNLYTLAVWGKERVVAGWWPRAHNSCSMSLHRFSNFDFLENFCNRFIRNYES